MKGNYQNWPLTIYFYCLLFIPKTKVEGWEELEVLKNILYIFLLMPDAYIFIKTVGT